MAGQLGVCSGSCLGKGAASEIGVVLWDCRAEVRDVPQVCCRELIQVLGGISLTCTQLKLFFFSLEPQALRKKKKTLIFVTGGRCVGGIM